MFAPSAALLDVQVRKATAKSIPAKKTGTENTIAANRVGEQQSSEQPGYEPMLGHVGPPVVDHGVGQKKRSQQGADYNSTHLPGRAEEER